MSTTPARTSASAGTPVPPTRSPVTGGPTATPPRPSTSSASGPMSAATSRSPTASTRSASRPARSRKYTRVSVRHIRKRHGIGLPRLAPAGPGELTVPEVAQVLGIHESSVYPWIRCGEMTAHQIRNRRWRIPWNPSIEAYWRTRVNESHHLKRPNSTYETKKAV
ncbi:excisionase family DNA-binding protein [Streptomyces sp. NPDC094438]|uniref:helix-turn-helix domain-containing protein n=1 Tax=Streptomyces sp. NPDC094438 TaxID=3366061 RepID=UPI00382EDE28